MPEGPEVETVKEVLKRKILNLKIKDIEVRWPNIVANKTVESFKKELKNKTFKNVERMGKFLLFNLQDLYLVSHLRMEGKYFVKDKNEELTKHDHIIFYLDNNQKLIYNDTRKFGRMYLLKESELKTKPPLNKLGMDPFDKKFTVAYLKEKLNKRKPIKTLLLEQTIILGIGNIYANEILFYAKLNPNVLGANLTTKNLTDIVKYTKEVLKKAIKAGGTTIRSYTSDEGIEGRFQQELFVHQQKICKKCHHEIVKISVGGRGTYYCPKCQK